MEEINKKFKINNIWYYVLFLLAFVCLGFVSSNNQAKAAGPTVKIIDDSKYNPGVGVVFYVGYDVSTVHTVKYKLNNGGSYVAVAATPEIFKDGKAKTLCSTEGIDPCTSVVLKYTIKLDDLTGIYSGNSSIDVTNTSQTKFKITVYASNEEKALWVIPVGGVTEKTSGYLSVDKTIPSVKNVVADREDVGGGSFLGIGKKVNFTVNFTESVFVDSNVRLNFKIGEKEVFALCQEKKESSSTTVCTYEIKDGENGDFSGFKLSSATSSTSRIIEDKYDNSVNSAISISNVVTNGLVVDGIKPTISNITALAGKYSVNKTIPVTVTFSEEINVVNDVTKIPVVKLKIGSGEFGCLFSYDSTNIKTKSLAYTCTPINGVSGNVSFSSISETYGFKDNAGNDINYSSAYGSSFDNVVVVSDLPTISTPIYNAVGCEINTDKYYCNKGDSITISFTFSSSGQASSSNVSIKSGDVFIFVGDYESHVGVSYPFALTNGSGTFTVVEGASGKVVIGYNGLVLKDNESGIENTVSDIIETDVYVDNDVPSVDGIEFGNSELFIDNVIHGKKDENIELNVKINDSSIISLLDSTKISLLNEQGTIISGGIISSSVLDNVLSIVIKTNVSFKLKVAVGAIKDMFDNMFLEDYVSDLFVVNNNAPDFSVNIEYPEYKGYEENGVGYLIGGNKLIYTVVSEDVDLSEVCYDAVCEGIDYSKIYEYIFESGADGRYSFTIKVKDRAGNETSKDVTFELKNVFEYNEDISLVSNNHVVGVDLSMFSVGTLYKYAWFARGVNVIQTSFNNANTASWQGEKSVISGNNTLNGDYKLCIYINDNGKILCSEYVSFDTRIDSFSVSLSSNGWTNDNIYTTITFNDISAIKCVAIGKNISSFNCDTVNDDVYVYRTSQAISPITNYVISENGVYRFYIEDMIGNSDYIEKIIDNQIDREVISINIYNGNDETSNLDISSYKKEHKFLVKFDEGNYISNSHKEYKYFFSVSDYEISSVTEFNSYYTNVSLGNKKVVTSCTGSLLITTPALNGTYNLYLMATDKASNVSFASVKGILIDAIGPGIKMYDSNNNETMGGSLSYIKTFEYSIVIEDIYSRLNLNTISYGWKNSSGEMVFEKEYKNCSFDYNTCVITSDNIEFGSDFNPNETYSLVVRATDNALNTSEFISSGFKIDTTAPSIDGGFDEFVWYNTNNFTFTVSKENAGTLNSISYCLNDCFNGQSYDKDNKFISLRINNYTSETKTINLSLNEGFNDLYVYADDYFGNYLYKKFTIKYDSEGSEIVVNNLNEDGVVDLSSAEDSVIDVTLKDINSGIKKYCTYIDINNKQCEDVNGKVINVKIAAPVNGIYYVEILDNASNSVTYNVNVLGVDLDPIEFDLTTNIKEGKFTNSNVTISVINMRKVMVDNASERVRKIDYVMLNNGSSITGYEELFVSGVDNVYDKDIDNELVSSFSVSGNGLYVVRVIDTASNVSYNTIEITCIDVDSPIINTNKYGDNTDRIYVDTVSGNNINVVVDGDDVIYKYSNETLKIYFGNDSLRDTYTGYNNYLGLKICFDAGECVYNTYNVRYNINDGNLINTAINVSAPYNFSGVIRYYLVDGANNASEAYSFNVVYQNEISEISVLLKDEGGNDLLENKKYNRFYVSFDGEEVEDIINSNNLKYAVVRSNVNLYNAFANREGTINSFLTEYDFISTNNVNCEVSKNNVDSSYYLWVYARDNLNNYKLFKVDSLINLDTINPLFSELDLSLNKVDAASYDLYVGSIKEGYKLYIDINNDGEYEEVELSNKVYNFTVSGVNSVGVRIVDEANNVTNDTFNLIDSSNIYMRVYQLDNSRKANVVIYNMGDKNVTSFGYILTGMDSNEVFDENSIMDGSLEECAQYDGATCKSYSYSLQSKNVYQINLSKDRKVIFYVYVNGNLIYDYNGNLLQTNIFVDNEAPVVNFDSSNPTIISTKNGNYTFNLNVVDANVSNNEYKYVFTTTTGITKANFENYYSTCFNSTTCARGVFNSSVEVNSNENKFNGLLTGNYYLYVYVNDAYGNYSVTKSALVFVDNEGPVIGYSLKDNNGKYETYTDINTKVFVGSAAKLRFVDNKDLYYFEISSLNGNKVVCYSNTVSGDINCDKSSGGEIGFIKEGNTVYYYLDNGDYTIVAYDTVLNSVQVEISVDNGNPLINLYKNNSGNYELQNSSAKIFNSLSDLYISVVDANFNYLTIDLENTKKGEIVRTVARYSYNSEVGSCLSDVNVCEYGKDLVSMLSDNTITYNKVIINVYDKANRNAKIEINYDDGIPTIWTINVGESVYIDGVLYTVEENMTINLAIGVNEKLSFDKLMEKIILDVDGLSYSQVKNFEMFNVSVYKEGSNFEGDLINTIGNYDIEIDYTDEAFNNALTKVIHINVLDNIAPTLRIVDVSSNAEVNSEVELFGVIAKDNYGLIKNGASVKEKTLPLNTASCVLSSNNEVLNCNDYLIEVRANVYKFGIVGEYTFTYTVIDLANNSNNITQVINVGDTSGPVMSSDDLLSKEIVFGDRNPNGELNIETLTFVYPSSYDNGDERRSDVEYVGLYALNNMGEKYKVSEDTFIVSNVGGFVTYKFDKVGVYYLRFMSGDSNNNISVFEYEVKVLDKTAPIVNGLLDGLKIDIEIDDEFNVEEDIIEYYNVEIIDNYDSNLRVYYEIHTDANFAYRVVLKGIDSSGNISSINVYVSFVDNEAPVSGELVLVESTNQRSLSFTIVGGFDNSNKFFHEYSVENGSWIKYSYDSKLEFGEGLNKNVNVCIRARDESNNISLNGMCKTVFVDTKKPIVSGVSDGNIFSEAVNVIVSDDNLLNVEVLHDGEIVETDGKTTFDFSELGVYTIKAVDTLGNITIVNFVINADTYMNVVNDINSDNKTITSIDFDKRILVKADVTYNNSGYSTFVVDLDNISVGANDVVYILGVVPDREYTFVMYSLNGENLKDYKDGVTLISDGNSFSEGINNEDCFLKLNNSYYAYLIVKEGVQEEQPVVNEEKQEEREKGSIGIGLIVAGSIVVAMVGYQIIRFRKRVRAA